MAVGSCSNLCYVRGVFKFGTDDVAGTLELNYFLPSLFTWRGAISELLDQ